MNSYVKNKCLLFVDIECEMDLLQCQKIRKLTTLYHQLKKPGAKLDRIEFLMELHSVLLAEEHSVVLEEVCTNLNYMKIDPVS